MRKAEELVGNRKLISQTNRHAIHGPKAAAKELIVDMHIVFRELKIKLLAHISLLISKPNFQFQALITNREKSLYQLQLPKCRANQPS